MTTQRTRQQRAPGERSRRRILEQAARLATAAELGARSGRIHDRVAAYQREWRDLLERTAIEAHQAGELDAGTDPAQLAFELSTILTGTNIVAVLHDDNAVIERARHAISARLAT